MKFFEIQSCYSYTVGGYQGFRRTRFPHPHEERGNSFPQTFGDDPFKELYLLGPETFY
jgi:hypothetical protein